MGRDPIYTYGPHHAIGIVVDLENNQQFKEIKNKLSQNKEEKKT